MPYSIDLFPSFSYISLYKGAVLNVNEKNMSQKMSPPPGFNPVSAPNIICFRRRKKRVRAREREREIQRKARYTERERDKKK